MKIRTLKHSYEASEIMRNLPDLLTIYRDQEKKRENEIYWVVSHKNEDYLMRVLKRSIKKSIQSNDKLYMSRFEAPKGLGDFSILRLEPDLMSDHRTHIVWQKYKI